MLTPSTGFWATPFTTAGAAWAQASRDGRHDVDHVVELDAAPVLDPGRPGDHHPVPGAAEVGRYPVNDDLDFGLVARRNEIAEALWRAETSSRRVEAKRLIAP